MIAIKKAFTHVAVVFLGFVIISFVYAMITGDFHVGPVGSGFMLGWFLALFIGYADGWSAHEKENPKQTGGW